MTQQVLIGLITEGTTDVRFLSSIVKRTFERLSILCWSDVEILDIVPIKIEKNRFVSEVLKASEKGLIQYGITVLCVHTDADADTDETMHANKINPALKALRESEDERCRNLVAIVPVQMQEAWLMADTSLLKKQIGTDKNDHELGLHRHPEKVADPKRAIEEAIRIARQELTRRRRRELKIGDLYQPIGQSIRLEALAVLPSYQKFEENVKTAFRLLDLLP